ncbi:hypothetical protein IWW39_001750 [Coemansia spiralis]|uniref:Uncharacterized protein n=1 Tax=Coemansia spiralis TaxID=417178 RepID=A0A9W8L695_9FUNG|nr:hypothetical protein IWW39_001750 [Coemansia spiralis]
MVMIEVRLKAELENVTDFQPVGVEHTWNFRDKMVMSGGRDTANMVIKCHFCRREGSLDIAEGPFPYTADDSGTMATILIVDCRGVDLKEFEPRSGWKATGTESKTLFDDVDLDEMEWFDYDAKAAMPVSVKDIKYEFAVSKREVKKNKNKSSDEGKGAGKDEGKDAGKGTGKDVGKGTGKGAGKRA